MKMKLSRTSWIILTIGVLIIVSGSLGMARSNQLKEQRQVEENLTASNQQLKVLQTDKLLAEQQDLQAKIKNATEELIKSKGYLAQPTESILTSENLFNIAKLCKVEITEIASPGQGASKLGDISFSVLPVTVIINGEVSDIIRFVSDLHANFLTGMCQSVEVTIPLPEEDELEEEIQEGEGEVIEGEEEITEEEAKKPLSRIKMSIYGYDYD